MDESGSPSPAHSSSQFVVAALVVTSGRALELHVRRARRTLHRQARTSELKASDSAPRTIRRMLAAIAALISLPLFFEEVQGLTPATVGILMVIYSIFLFAASWPGGRWSDRAGAAVGPVPHVRYPAAGDLELDDHVVAPARRPRSALGVGVRQRPGVPGRVEVVEDGGRVAHESPVPSPSMSS